MANSVMERICEKRKEEGFPALAIQWGAIGDVGVIVDVQANIETELQIAGLGQQKISNCLQVLNGFLRQEEPIVDSMLVGHKAAFTCENIVDRIFNILGITGQEQDNLHLTSAELGMDSYNERRNQADPGKRARNIFVITRHQILECEQELIKEKGEMKKLGESIEEHENVFRSLKYFVRPAETEMSLRDQPVIRMGDGTDGAVKIFVLSGLEGTVILMKPLIETFDGNVGCIQYGFETNFNTVEEWADAIFPYINVEDNFVLVAHSFGCVVATQLAFLLEKNGQQGKLVCIDDGPKMMPDIYKKLFSSEGAEFWETNIACMCMMRHLPVLKLKSEMLKCTSLEDRIKLCLSKSDDHLDASLLHASVQYCRKLRALLEYSPKFPKLKSRLKLIKPKQAVVLGASKDYGFSSLFEKVEKVEEFEEEHSSVLENPEMARAINKFIRDDKDVIQ